MSVFQNERRWKARFLLPMSLKLRKQSKRRITGDATTNNNASKLVMRLPILIKTDPYDICGD